MSVINFYNRVYNGDMFWQDIWKSTKYSYFSKLYKFIFIKYYIKNFFSYYLPFFFKYKILTFNNIFTFKEIRFIKEMYTQWIFSFFIDSIQIEENLIKKELSILINIFDIAKITNPKDFSPRKKRHISFNNFFKNYLNNPFILRFNKKSRFLPLTSVSSYVHNNLINFFLMLNQRLFKKTILLSSFSSSFYFLFNHTSLVDEETIYEIEEEKKKKIEKFKEKSKLYKHVYAHEKKKKNKNLDFLVEEKKEEFKRVIDMDVFDFIDASNLNTEKIFKENLILFSRYKKKIFFIFKKFFLNFKNSNIINSKFKKMQYILKKKKYKKKHFIFFLLNLSPLLNKSFIFKKFKKLYLKKKLKKNYLYFFKSFFNFLEYMYINASLFKLNNIHNLKTIFYKNYKLSFYAYDSFLKSFAVDLTWFKNIFISFLLENIKKLFKTSNFKISCDINLLFLPTATVLSEYIKFYLKRKLTINKIVYSFLSSIRKQHPEVLGLRIRYAGRISRSPRKKVKWFSIGFLKKSNLYNYHMIDFASNYVILKYGVSSIKVWLYTKNVGKYLI